MTSMEKKTPTRTPGECRRAGRPGPGRSADFDRHHGEAGEAIRAYAIAAGWRPRRAARPPGLLALFILKRRGRPRRSRACSTWPTCSSRCRQTIIAMGLAFVLLTGEIDLAAGTASASPPR
jgi:hypothetical protein